MGPMPSGLAGQFIGALVLSHYFWVVAALQIAGGVLLLVNRFVPLGLVLLGPVIVNIILYHGFLNPSGAAPAIVRTVLWFIVFYAHRQYFSGIFVQRTVRSQELNAAWRGITLKAWLIPAQAAVPTRAARVGWKCLL